MSQLLSLVLYDDHFDHWKSAIFAIIIASITEPLYGSLEDVVSVRPFSLVFQQNRHIKNGFAAYCYCQAPATKTTTKEARK